jgi:hypothetical protein
MLKIMSWATKTIPAGMSVSDYFLIGTMYHRYQSLPIFLRKYRSCINHPNQDVMSLGGGLFNMIRPIILPQENIDLNHFPNRATICTLGKYKSMIRQQYVNLGHSLQGESLSTSNLLCLDHSLPQECLSTSTLTIHLSGNHLQH